MIQKIRSMILDLCKNQKWDWENHILSVVKYSKQLAQQLDADIEICEVSAWLHDISKLKGKKDDHPVTGSEDAANILKSFNYPQDKIDQVKHCILTHSTDSPSKPQSIEAKIVASADGMSHFDNFLALAYHAYALKGLSLQDGKQHMIKKYDKCWAKMIPEAHSLVEEKYAHIKYILK